jgi:hypothetical protein
MKIQKVPRWPFLHAKTHGASNLEIPQRPGTDLLDVTLTIVARIQSVDPHVRFSSVCVRPSATAMAMYGLSADPPPHWRVLRPGAAHC